MKYSLNLKIKEDKKKEFLNALLTYNRKLDRSETKLEETDYGVLITIESKDIHALRAALNSLTNAINIFQKSKKINEN